MIQWLDWLQHLVDDPCLKKSNQKNIFFEPLYPLSSQSYNL